uniref:ATP synthase complex subunit 8 n=1 Tax=Sceleocantha glabricollis TaxID=2547839 RepID=A0A7G8JRS8_9CUCU|nr:ATP synthase F0 subunit 8 [Sceleocantha glabricollis]
MPQMAPLNWLTLFLFFSITFIIFNTMNFFSFNYTIKTKKTSKTKPIFNWKW